MLFIYLDSNLDEASSLGGGEGGEGGGGSRKFRKDDQDTCQVYSY